MYNVLCHPSVCVCIYACMSFSVPLFQTMVTINSYANNHWLTGYMHWLDWNLKRQFSFRCSHAVSFSCCLSTFLCIPANAFVCFIYFCFSFFLSVRFFSELVYLLFCSFIRFRASQHRLPFSLPCIFLLRKKVKKRERERGRMCLKIYDL